LAKYIEIFRDSQKRTKAIKHLPKNLLIPFKSLENQMNKILMEWGNFYIDIGKEAGFDVLFPLLERDAFDAYTIDEPGGKETFTSINKLDVYKHNKPAKSAFELVWLMPFTFFSEILLPQNCCTVVKDIEPNKPFLVKAFELPNLNILTTQELKSLQKQLPYQITDFQQTVDEWAKECYKGNASKIFTETLEPLFAATSNALDNNDILQHCNNVHFGKARTTVFMGAVSPLDIWTFYCNEGQLTIEEKQELEADYSSGSNYFVPIMFFAKNADIYQPIVVEDAEVSDKIIDDIVSAKKNINVDD
jgi:hypothetical protein